MSVLVNGKRPLVKKREQIRIKAVILIRTLKNKKMKGLKIFLIAGLLFTLPFYLQAQQETSHVRVGNGASITNGSHHHGGGHHHGGHHHGGHHGGNTTGAPLDGGLLTILGAAGISYYLIRKKKTQ